ncbi:MAG: M23 family metallopeptidase [Elusimicrobiota bacterium]
MTSEGEIDPGQSIYQVLRENFSSLQAVNIGQALSSISESSYISPGDRYKIYHSTSGELLRFIYEPDPLLNYVVEKTTEGYTAEKFVPEYEKKTVAVKGQVETSLWQGMTGVGLDSTMIMNFANIFQWQVDFFTEVRPQDKFLLVFERYYRDGIPVRDGSIIAAWYKGKRVEHTGIRFEDSGSVDYYDASGNSLRKQFLSTPLNYTRISSRFSYSRKHPIYRKVRPHLAIDYAAPTGTPVETIGSGRVTHVGWRGGWGRTVRVRHNSVYTTQYAHLNRYAPGIKKGDYVTQGQVVGYVGMTGTATGPHLDFRIERRGKPVNFLKLEFPPASSVSDENMESFKKYVDRARRYHEYLEDDFFAGSINPIEDFMSSS